MVSSWLLWSSYGRNVLYPLHCQTEETKNEQDFTHFEQNLSNRKLIGVTNQISSKSVKGNSHMISPDRTRLISILLSNSRLPGHLSPDLWHSMLIILILLIHATTRQQWNASWQSKRRRSAQILSTAIVTVALATRTGMKRVGTRPDGRRCHVPMWKRWNTASYIFGSRMLI